MSEPYWTDGLGDLLHRATDAVSAPADRPAGALAEARRRRRQRRGALAVSLAGVAAVVATVVVQASSGTPDVAPPVTPAPLPTTTTHPPSRAPWDPNEVADLPQAPDGLVPALPARIDPPSSSPALSGDPLGAAVAVVSDRDFAQLLGTDGTWRTVTLDGEHPLASLSPRGTHLLITSDDDHAHVVVDDLGTGRRGTIPYPADYSPTDSASWSWVDEHHLLLRGAPDSWLVDVDDGAAEKVPFPRFYGSASPDPSGAVVESSPYGQPARVVDWAGWPGHRPRTSDISDIGHLEQIAVGDHLVAGTAHDVRPWSVVLADRDTLATVATLPLFDSTGTYSNGGLSVMGVPADELVLMRLVVFGPRPSYSFRVIAWDPATNALTLASRTAPQSDGSVDFAEGLLSSS